MQFLSINSGRNRFTLSSTAWILLIFSITYLFSVRYFHYASSRDPTSYFFDPYHAFEKRYSAQRLKEAEAFIASANNSLPSDLQTPNPPFMCVGISTVSRRGEQYVHLTVGSLLAGLTADERKSIYVNLLLGHTNPSKHPNAQEPWFNTLPNKVLTYRANDSELRQIKAWEDGGLYRIKTIYDYTYLLKDCYDIGAQYVAIFEDDTLAMAGWFARAKEALRAVENEMVKLPQSQRWIYLRLFYSDDLLGWNSEDWPRYLFWSVIVWGFVTAIMLAANKRFKRTADLRLTSNNILAISTICVALTIALYFMAGRHTTHPLAPGIRVMNKYGCCSQALVYPRSIIPDFLAQTDLTTDWLVDMMVEKIADHYGWIRWATVPSLLQHIGATSSKGYGFDDNAKKLWSFRFEDWQT